MFAELTNEVLARTREPMGSKSTYKLLGKAIARHRSRVGMTQQGLADAIGVSRASIANIERGEQRVYLDQVLSVKDAFHLSSLEELLAGASLSADNNIEISLSGDKLKRKQAKKVKSLVERYMVEAK